MFLRRTSSGGGDGYKRTANDTCVYVTKPGDATKKMIVVRTGESWDWFLQCVSLKLDIQARRIFNTHDEINQVSDLVQGDVLYVQPGNYDDGSPKSPMAGRAAVGAHSQVMNWIRVVRLLNLQCVKGYLVTEVMKSGRYSETLRAKRIKDDQPVVIKRVGETASVKMNTLKSYMLETWSIRHPYYAHNIDIFVSDDARRPLGGAKKRKRVRQGEKHQALVMVMERYERNLESLMDERIKLQKQLTSEEIMGFVTQILQFLHYLHTEMRIVHHNLKMSNLLVDDTGTVFVHDIALPTTDPGALAYDMRHTSRAIPGKRHTTLSAYSSPEACKTGCTSEKDDIWALGCIITELVTHKLVGDRVGDDTFGRSLGAVAQAVAEVAIKDSALGSLARTLLEVDKAKRPTAMEALWKHLRGAHVSQLIPAMRPLTSHEMANVSSLSKSNDIPTLLSAVLKEGEYQAMEAAIARLNEILYHEPGKRASMREVYATQFGRLSGIAAMCMCLAKGSPPAQHSAAAAIRTTMLDDDNDEHVSLTDVEIIVSAVIMGTAQTQLLRSSAGEHLLPEPREPRQGPQGGRHGGPGGPSRGLHPSRAHHPHGNARGGISH